MKRQLLEKVEKARQLLELEKTKKTQLSAQRK